MALDLTLLSVTLAVALSALTAGAQTPPKSRVDPATEAQQGMNLAGVGRCPEALPILKKSAARIADKDLKKRAALAGVRCALALNQQGAAGDFLSLLSREFPGDPEVLYVTVHAYSDLSERAALQLARMAPSSIPAIELDAESLEVQGRWDEATEKYRKILQQNPGMIGMHYRIGRALLSKTSSDPVVSEEARKEFEQELQLDPNNPGAEYVLAGLARRDARLEEAIQHYSRASQLDPTLGDAFLGLGAALVDARRFAEAVPQLERAVKLEPQNPTAHFQLATAYSRSGRKDDADREFAVHRDLAEKARAAGGTPPDAAPPDRPQ
jgi:tetratricopeptide (TPR) repeat protein